MKKTVKRVVRVRATEEDWAMIDRLQKIAGAQSLNELVAISLEYFAGYVADEIRSKQLMAQAEARAQEEIKQKEREMGIIQVQKPGLVDASGRPIK